MSKRTRYSHVKYLTSGLLLLIFGLGQFKYHLLVLRKSSLGLNLCLHCGYNLLSQQTGSGSIIPALLKRLDLF